MKIQKMKIKILIAACLCLGISSINPVWAQSTLASSNAASSAIIDELFKVMQIEKSMGMIDMQIHEASKRMAESMRITEAQKPIFDRFIVRYTALMKDEMSWGKLKGPIAQVYADVYTDAEMKDIIKFYKSPVGQKVLAKMPELMNASIQVAQNSMKNIMPKIIQLQQEFDKELNAAASKNKK